MNSIDKIRICKTRNVKTPTRAHTFDAGCDFFCPDDLTPEEMTEKFKTTGDQLDVVVESGFIKRFIIKPGQSVLIPSGIKVNVPNGYVLNFENKSGVASKKHLLFGSKVIDAGYEGIVHVNLHNVGTHTVTIDAGEKIAQALMYKIEVPAVEVVDEQVLYNGVKSERGEGGFGSTDNQ